MQATKLRIKLTVRSAPIKFLALRKTASQLGELQFSRRRELDFTEIKQAKSTFFG